MKCCLIVDDSKVVRMVARKILEALQFEIVEAGDGQQAMEACERAMPDAILLDWNMPVMNGIDFLRQLRQHAGGERPVVIFCTTENDMAHIQEALGAGANEYIMKPFDSDIVESKFAQVGLLYNMAAPTTTGGSAAGPKAARGTGGDTDAFRVMVVDDSAVVRGLVTRFLQEDPELSVAASCGNGQRAVEELKRTPVDVIVLDIEMPVMDGLTALPKLLEVQPGVQIVMASTLTRLNADVSLKAMAAGAADYIAKPSSTGGLHGTGTYQQELRSKVKALAQQHRRTRGGKSLGPVRPQGAADAGRTASGAARPSPAGPRAASPAGDGEIKLRPMPTHRPDVLAIGSSTGGPQALFKFLGGLGRVTQPVLITQHMPATFTALLADHIGRQTKLTCSEGRDGDPLAGGHVYIAPGGKHMTVAKDAGGQLRIKLDDGPPENFCKPSVDPMLRSLSRVYGGRLLTVILTGMGSDGLKGAEVAVQAGAHVLAQDEATSVVWGMPRAVAKAGLCSAVLPIGELATAVQKLIVRNAA